MSDTETAPPGPRPRAARLRKNAVAPLTEKQGKQNRKPYQRTPRAKGGENQQRVLSPKHLQVLDLFLDPELATITDVAHRAGVYQKTISRWMIENPLFREEYWRRVRQRAEQVGALGVAGFEKALRWAMSVLDAKEATFEEKRQAAKMLIDSQRIKVELNTAVAVHQSNHVHVSGPIPTKSDSTEAIPAMRRLQAVGMTPREAAATELSEMQVILDQLKVEVAAMEPGVIDGEVVSSQEGTSG